MAVMGLNHHINKVEKAKGGNPPSITCIPKRKQRSILPQNIKQNKAKETGSIFHFYPIAVNKHSLINDYKSFQIKTTLKGTALCLLKTKFAIKPKTPV